MIDEFLGESPVAVVTGASRRVGRAVAIRLAEAGFDLLMTYHRRLDEMEETMVKVSTARPRSETSRVTQMAMRRVDLDDPKDVEEYGAYIASLSRLDAIVHNASTYDRISYAVLNAKDLHRHYQVNAVAPALLTRAAFPLLAESRMNGGGSVVCFTDIQAMGRPQKDYLAYAMSKAALGQMVESLARELAPQVRVNGIAPGVIAWPEDVPQAQREAYESRVPLGRAGTPEDAAETVRWLIMDAPYITGEIIRLDGGRWLR